MPSRSCPRHHRLALLAALLGGAGPLAAQEPAPADTTVLRADSASVQDVHPQDEQDDRGFEITRDRGRARLRLYGSVRLAGFYDFGGLSGSADFSTYDIEVGADGLDPRFDMDATQTRFGFEGSRDTTPLGPLSFRIEMDFRGNEGTSLRLRHAYAVAGPIQAGFTWSTFAHVSALPVTVDFEGPPSSVSLRSPLIRYTFLRPGNQEFAVAIESQDADLPLVADTLGTTYQSMPDLVARFRRTGVNHEMQVAAVFRGIEYELYDNTHYTLGFGSEFSGRTSLGPFSEVVWQLVLGTGIARYIKGLSGNGLDLGLNRETGDVHALPVFGWVVSGGHAWSDNRRSYIVVGGNRVWQPDGSPPDTYASSQYVAMNYFWDLMPGLQLGAELTLGRRENVNGESGDAGRLGFISRYDF